MNNCSLKQKYKLKNPVVTIGTFDGVHKGHHAVISKLLQTAQATGGTSTVITFQQHPRHVLGIESDSLKLLSLVNEKVELLKNLGVSEVLVCEFTPEFAAMSSDDFIKEFLVKELNIHVLVVGYDHHFGKNRQGNFQTLQQSAQEHGFTIARVDAMQVDSINISSTKIRNLIQAGQISLANKYLGYSYFFSGSVEKGKQLGAKIGFPTANLCINSSKQIPGVGVYAVKVKCQGFYYHGMMNIGYRPTVDDTGLHKSVEVNIFDFNQNIYNYEIRVEVVERIRDEKKFSGINELTQQLAIDKENVKKILAHSEPIL